MQRAFTTTRIARAAMFLAGTNDQGVEFIIQRHVGREAALEEATDFFVGVLCSGELMTLEHAPRVGVNHEDRVLAGVEENGIRGFRADAVDREELLAQNRRNCAEHFSKRSVVFVAQKARECFQRPGFLAKVAGRTDQAREARRGKRGDGVGREKFPAAQIADGQLDVGPGSILRQNSADDDLETRSAGPPALRTMRG